MTVVVDLGGGTRPHPRADVVIDLHHPVGSPRQDATETPWLIESGTGRAASLADGSVDEIVSSHFLEHVPHGQPLLDVMNECWRVLRPGGTFTAILPVVGWEHPNLGNHWTVRYEPWADPTHVSYWWLPQGVHYFTGATSADAEYGIDLWEPGCGYVSPEHATQQLQAQEIEPVVLGSQRSWWTVRGGWEGCFRIVKPEGDE